MLSRRWLRDRLLGQPDSLFMMSSSVVVIVIKVMVIVIVIGVLELKLIGNCNFFKSNYFEKRLGSRLNPDYYLKTLKTSSIS